MLKADHLSKSFGDRVLIDDLSFELPRNGIVGVIGPNGVGKSTLFKMIVAQSSHDQAPQSDKAVLPTSGTLELGPTVQLSYVDQMRGGLEGDKSVRETVSDGNDFITVGKDQINSRAYLASFAALRGLTSKSQHTYSPAASATV